MDRSELLDALSDVAEILGRRNVSGRVYIVGGAAMALTYASRRVTRDVERLILDGHGSVIDAVREVARHKGLPGSWLNEQASAYLPPADDHKGEVVFDHPNLRVIAAPPAKLLAMKVRAARRPDVADIEVLVALLGLKSAAEVFDVVKSVFPGETVPERGRVVVEELFESYEASR